MAQRTRRRLFERVLLWEPASGTILDLPTRYVLPMDGPAESEDYADLTTGSKRPIGRSNQVQIPVTARELALMGEVLQRLKCPMKAAFIGPKETDNFLWLEPTRLQVRDPDIASGQQAQKVLELESTVFFPGIWEGEDTLAGVPWQGTKDWKDPDSGTVFLRPKGNIRAGYEGPLWEISGTDATGREALLDGSTSGINVSNPAVIRTQFPAWGATLRLDAPPGYLINDGEIRAYDYGGNLLTSGTGDGAEITLPNGTWEIEVVIQDTQARPRVRVVESGARDVVAYVGKTTPDCQPVDDPDYSILPNPNEKPFWKQTEFLLYKPNNDPPTWEDRDDLLHYKTSSTQTNTAPTFENRDDLVYFKKGKALDFEVQDATRVYTGRNGLSTFDYPGGGNYSIIFDRLADGQIVVDENYPAVWAAQDGGIVRFDPLAKSIPPPTTNILDTSPNNVRGLGIDTGTRTLYYTFESTQGLFSTDYDGATGQETVDATLSADEFYLAVDSFYNEGYIFAASNQRKSGNGEIIRLLLDGTNQTSIIDGSNYIEDVYGGVKVSQSLNRLVFQLRTGSDKRLIESDYDGTNQSSIVGVFSSVTTDDLRFGVADKEGVVVRIGEVEGGLANVSFNLLDGATSAKPSSFSINNADTGERVAVANSITVITNTAPTFESRDNLSFEK